MPEASATAPMAGTGFGDGSVLMVLESWGDGGTEAYVAQLGAWLARHGLRPSVCLLGGASGNFDGAAASWADEVHVLDRPRGRKSAAFARLLRSVRPQICHLHLYSSLLPAVLAARTVRSARLVATLHMPSWQWSLRHRLAWRMALGLTDAVTANSRAVLRSVGRWPRTGSTWLTPAPLHRQLIGPPMTGARPVRADREGAFLVAGAGRLAREKDWPTLLQAFAALRATGVNARLLLCGTGPLAGDLRSLADRLGIADRLEMPGVLPHAELFGRVAAADAFVLPSRFEGLGMAAIEAMALGVPTVTADFEASEDYVEEGVTGWRFPRGDHSALAQLLLLLAGDRAAAQDVAERGQTQVLARFGEDTVFTPFLEAYDHEAR